MSTYTERFTEVSQYLGGINPASYNSVQDTGYVSFANFHRGVVIVHAGVLGQNVDFDFEEATSTAGAGAQSFDSAGKDFLLTATTDNNTVSVVEIKSEEFDVDNNYDCLNVECTPAGSSSIFSLQIWGLVPRFAPVSTTGLDSVTD